jgi:serine/threonine protein kinase
MSEPPLNPSREERIDKVIADYLAAAEAGPRPDPRPWLDRFPDLADELRSFFANRDGFLAFAGDSPAPPAPPAQRPGKLSPVSPGGHVGDYELLEELGRGGMGVVYKARHTRLGREAALKLLLDAERVTPDELHRFRREAEVVARLEHPHIVPIYETGLCDEIPYLSMKLIEGGNLARALAEGRWPVGEQESQRQVAALLVKIARAVHYAHQRGILHRDLKPANVMLDEQGEPHVTDFGLARRLSGGTCLTQTGAIVGTPYYMAPEQAAGATDITTAADVYSLGAILYELLTGRPPFEGESVLKTLLRVQEEEPARPRILHRGIDRDLESVCLKCLEKDPSRRYGSAEALADDLERWLRRESVAARPIRRIGRLVKWGRRRPAIATLLALCLLTGLGTSAVFLRPSSSKPEDQPDYERKFQRYLEAVQAAAVELEPGKPDWAPPDVAHRQRARELLDSCPAELRALEWYCLDSLCKGAAPADPRLYHAPERSRGRPAPGGGFLSPDGKFRWHNWVVYNTASGRPLFGWFPHGIFVGFSKDGQRFISCDLRASADPGRPLRIAGSVTIRETSTGRSILRLPGVAVAFTTKVRGMRFNAAGELIPDPFQDFSDVYASLNSHILLVDGEQLAWYGVNPGRGDSKPSWHTIKVTGP